MRKYALFCALCAVVWVAAQTSHPYPTASLEQQLRDDPHRFGVNMHSYEFFDLEDTPAPEGYVPFYISHYGRHGSRSNWGDKDYRMVINVLDSAQMEGVLTPAGAELLTIAKRVLAAYNGMDGRLTDRGEREHAQLATRMYNRYPEVWQIKQPRVVSVGSLVPRSIISMTSFTNTLSQLHGHIDYNFDCGEQMQKYIDCTGARDKDFSARCKELEKAAIAHLPYDSTQAVERLFTAMPQSLQGKSIRRWQKAIYYTCAIAQDFDIEANMLDYLAFETAYYYNMEQTMHIVVEKCNTLGAGLERMPNAQIALDEIVASADSAIRSFDETPQHPIVANLRFGHDYPLLYMVNRMGVSGVGDTTRIEDIEGKWLAHLHICMASNLQLIFYRNNANDILVKVLYNEREHRLNGLTPIDGIYYRWEDVKAKWTNKSERR